MEIKEIKTLARLARLEFSDETCKEFAPEFEEIIQFANTINREIGGADGVKDTGGQTLNWQDLRQDEVKESLPAEKILSGKHTENGYFTVRRVIK